MLKYSYNFFCAFLNEKNLNFVFPMSLCGCVYAEQTALDYDMHFFRLYEKSTKKVHEGLASPLDSRGRRKTSAPLRSAGFTAILEIPHYAETQESAVYLYLLATAG